MRERGGWAGLSLIGLLVVMVIVLIMMTASPGGSGAGAGAGGGNAAPGGGGYLGRSLQSRRDAAAMRTQMDLSQIATLVAQYELSNGRYPESLADLGLDTRPEYRGVETDFRVIDEGGAPKRFEIVTPGEDETLGTDDDEIASAPLPI
ncbi:MAG: hypothetical protein AAF138_05670 [Planctomycetota bacterium]